MHEITPEDWTTHDFYILGAPTWFDGECSQDWNWYVKDEEGFGAIDFTNKTVAIYGLGDQEGYPDFYCDAIGILGKIVLHNGGELIGYSSTDGHKFNHSKGYDDDSGHFMGLALDEDNQPDQSHDRIQSWIKLSLIHI